jgi:hypothetical protein
MTNRRTFIALSALTASLLPFKKVTGADRIRFVW